MAEIKINLIPPCLIFPGRKCIPTCPNYPIALERVLETAALFGTTPQDVIDSVRNADKKSSPFIQTEKFTKMKHVEDDLIIVNCLNEPKF